MKKNITIVSIVLVSVFLFTILFFRNSTNIKDYEVVEKNPIGTTVTAIMANGCFWCAEADFEKLNGVKMVVSGYSGGNTENPNYSNYSAGGYREVVEITYDPKIVSYSNLVLYLIKHGDPTDGGGSFYDRGLEYAPAVYYDTEQEKSEALKVISDINAQKVYTKPLDLVVTPRTKFYPAEDYHQDYYKKNPLKYSYYRNGSGRDAFIKKYWGENTGVKTEVSTSTSNSSLKTTWTDFKKPSEEKLRSTLTPIQYKVTQQNGTETPFANEYDKNDKDGIYVDIVSGEPLYSSKDKYDSGTGWPSFVKPIYSDVVALKEDFGIFGNRVEARSKYADSHLGHVFNDGPVERGGKRYCMNSAALRFIPKDMMEKEGYGEYVRFI